MSHADLSHNDLIAALAESPGSSALWREFYDRYHRFICSVIYEESRRRGYRAGSEFPEDIAQEVYCILLRNEAHALKSFEGRFEKSILKYLEMISVRETYKHMMQAQAQKRIPDKRLRSLQEPVKGAGGERETPLGALLSAPDGEAGFQEAEMLEQIQHCMNTTAARRRNGSQYILIYKFHLFEGFSPEAIAEQSGIGLSVKRISNVITEMKAGVQECLKRHGIGR